MYVFNFVMIYWLTYKNNHKISNNFTEIFKVLPSSSQPPLLLVCFFSPPSEEHFRGEFGLLLLKREADVGPRVLREHRLSLSHLLCESAGCFMHPRVVWPTERCDAEGCDPFVFFISNSVVIRFPDQHASLAWVHFLTSVNFDRRRRWRTGRKWEHSAVFSPQALIYLPEINWNIYYKHNFYYILIMKLGSFTYLYELVL